MTPLGLATEIVDAGIYERAVARLREARVVLPTFAQLADPATIPASIAGEAEAVDAEAPHAANLFRVHWYNDAERKGRTEVPGYLVLPESLSGVAAPIVVALGERFPMIGAHKVLAAHRRRAG